jgi:hypothetical protein
MQQQRMRHQRLPSGLLQIQSAAEVQHLLMCHPNRLIVLHVGVAGCQLHEVSLRPAVALDAGAAS